MPWKTGVTSSKVEEDRALQLCRERKKFVKQAVDGWGSLVYAHVTYVESLRNVGTALTKFFETEAPKESPLYTSTSATPEPLALTKKSIFQFSFSPPSGSHRSHGKGALSPSPSPDSSSVQASYMKFQGSYSTRVEETLAPPATQTVTSSHTPENVPNCSSKKPETLPMKNPAVPPGSPLWDYFGHSHPIDHQFSFLEGKRVRQGSGNSDDVRKLVDEKEVSEPEYDEEKDSFSSAEGSLDSEDQYSVASVDTPAGRSENSNMVNDEGKPSLSPTRASGMNSLKGEKGYSPDLSPLWKTSPVADLEADTEKISLADLEADTEKMSFEEDYSGAKFHPNDFISSINDIERLFQKASEFGKEVPRMLEASKLNIQLVCPRKEKKGEPIVLKYLRACFSCGEDYWQVQESAQTAAKYLTWHGTAASHSVSSWNALRLNPKDEIEELSDNFDNFCMISGSHASTLDRLYAWERKLYDEVKASGIIRRKYDLTCKLLTELESKDAPRTRIDKTRAEIKDLHSRIRVAIQRIDSISKSIEELRDKELQPQLEELIEGFRRMWELMSECHSLQFAIISVAYNNCEGKIIIQRQKTVYLQSELGFLSTSFMKWIAAQKFYLQAINDWIYKCVSIHEKTPKRKRGAKPPSIRNFGPPIYETCGVWLEMFDSLPTKEVTDSIKGLAAEVSSFLPREEKSQKKIGKWLHPSPLNADNERDPALDILLSNEAPEEWTSHFDHFRLRLTDVLFQLNNYAESSEKKYAELEKAVQDAKSKYEHLKSQ
ncbi:hypothetical protein BT93_J0408 [Corymbia citriodora subsp. variegata]|nr:hypothetical protein BT93_J0408 [Corymbia citriodora subsp. variegata]